MLKEAPVQLSDVTDLAGPPLLERFFLVNPVPTALAALFVGVLLFEVLRRKRKEKLATVAFASGVGVATAILLIGIGVVTPYELARRATERFVDLAASGNRDAVEDMLTGRFELTLSESDASRDADWLLDRVEGLGRIVVSNRRKWRGGVMRLPRFAKTRMTLRTELNFSGVPDRYASTWDFYWRRDSRGNWKLDRLEAISLVGQKPWHGWSDEGPFPMNNQ